MRILLGQAYLVLNNAEEVYPVELYFDDMKLKKRHAYIKNDVVYIYHGRLKNAADSSIPGIYKTSDGYIFVEPSKKDIENIYSVDNVVDLDINNIIVKISKNADAFQQPEDIEIINSNSELYVPTIKETDDFLKLLVKLIIIDKKINIRNYKDCFANEYALNNMKSGLKRDTKMTVTNFKAWCEILGVRWKIVVEDNGTDTMNPLPNSIEIDSSQF